MTGFVAVHTGAGNCVNETKYFKVVRESCMQGIETFRNGGSAMDACEAAIISLENAGSTNAGFGSNLTWDGKIECEASIMNGTNLQFGACTNLTNIKNPIQLARVISDRQTNMLSMQRIPPMILSGEGASNYAKEIGGVTIVEEGALVSNKAVKCYEHFKKKVENFHIKNFEEISALDTVGAICVDLDGNCAAGCSSGGLILKISGRIGQAATYGAGCWAQKTDNNCVATCTTGNGEYLMKTILAKEISDVLTTSNCPTTSLNETFKTKFLESPFLDRQKDLYGGSLALVYDFRSGNGEFLWSHSTKSFCLGYMTTSNKFPKFINSSLPVYGLPGKSVVVNGQTFRLS